MNREEFMYSIDNISEVDLMNAFHQYMAFYNLYNDVCESDNVKISRSSEPAAFDLTFSHKSYAEKTYSTFNGAYVKIYNIPYYIQCVLDNKQLRVFLLLQKPDMGI